MIKAETLMVILIVGAAAGYVVHMLYKKFRGVSKKATCDVDCGCGDEKRPASQK